jgi:hypothetical protein
MKHPSDEQDRISREVRRLELLEGGATREEAERLLEGEVRQLFRAGNGTASTKVSTIGAPPADLRDVVAELRRLRLTIAPTDLAALSATLLASREDWSAEAISNSVSAAIRIRDEVATRLREEREARD